MQKRLTRAEVPAAETWNLRDLFATQEAWEAEMAAVETGVADVVAYQGRLGEGADVLLACLAADEALQERLVRAYHYASLSAAADGTSTRNQGLMARAAALEATVAAALSFIESEILVLPEGRVAEYLATEPGLAPYRPKLDRLLSTRPYRLAPETEATLAALGEVQGAPYMIYERAKNSDMQFPSIQDAQGNEIAMSFARYEDHYEGSAETEMRRKAFGSFTQGLKSLQNTMAATFATEVKKNVVLARLRKHPSAVAMHLHAQQVPHQAYNNLLDIIQAELAPHFQRYQRLRKRQLGLEKLYYCDIKAPLDPGYDPKISFADTEALISDAMAVMGPEYVEIIRTAFRERWIDRADNIGKTTGAFCASPYGAHAYVLITWTNALRGAFVLAHELGHAGHFELAGRHQKLTNFEPSLFFVEAPSTCNELLLGQHILAKSNDVRMRRWVITQMLGTYHHNFITHLLEAELERRIYAMAEAGEPVTAETLSETKGEIQARFWGDTVEIDEGAKLTWARQPHYYMNLYPYTYSAGLTCATAVAQQIRAEGRPAAERWLEVLKNGGAKQPLELMQMAGVDLAQAEPVRQAVAYVGSLVDELEKSFAD